MADFLSLKNSIKGDIVEPNSSDYSAAIARWAVNAERTLKARYIVFPKDEADISLSLKFAVSNGIPLAIKGGGHNPSGASSIEDGLCIDLSRYFNTAKIDTAQSVVHVGGGATWKTVDVATIAHGLATTGGTVNHTGVGGLCLGGGYGWLMAEHGLVIDNLVQATVVTANGTVVTASTTSHTDLFWGIRGGGSNFGLVTEFVLKVYPQRKTVFGGLIVFPPPVLSKVVEAVDKWWVSASEKEGIILVFSRGPDKQPAVIASLFFNGSEAEGRANFKWLYDLGPVADLAWEIPFEHLNGALNSEVNFGRYRYMTGTSLRSTMSARAVRAFEHMVSISETPSPQSTLPALDVLVVYEFLSLQKVCTVPSDATAFRSRGPQPNVVVVASWDKQKEGSDSATLQHVRSGAKKLVKIIESTEDRPLKENENEVYGNYVTDSTEMTDRIRQLWGDNYPKLQKVKKQYDPNCVFGRWFPIQPA